MGAWRSFFSVPRASSPVCPQRDRADDLGSAAAPGQAWTCRSHADTHQRVFLRHGLDEAHQVLLLGLLQLRDQGCEAAEAPVDGLRLSAVERRQHSQQHVVTCKEAQAVITSEEKTRKQPG